MKLVWRGTLRLWSAVFTVALLPLGAGGQTCQTSGELDNATRTSITTTAERYFDKPTRGDAASLRQNSIPTLT